MKGSVKSSGALLIIESANKGFWGRIDNNDNLLVDTASTIPALITKMKKLLYDVEGVKVENFDLSFDLTAFFEQYSYLSISTIGIRAGISPVLMRQYASGIKFPSADRVKAIEAAIREIGKELAKAKLHKTKKETTGK